MRRLFEEYAAIAAERKVEHRLLKHPDQATAFSVLYPRIILPTTTATKISKTASYLIASNEPENMQNAPNGPNYSI